MQNISKYVQINDFLLLEYEFSRDGVELTTGEIGAAKVVVTDSSIKQYYNTNHNFALGTTNNILELNAVPTTSVRSTWFTSTNIADYNDYFTDSSTLISEPYPFDTVKVHVVSGYNFDDVAGFLLQVGAATVDSNNLVNLSNFAYLKQDPDTKGSDVVKFSSNVLYLGNKFYDKYVEFKIPSVYALGGQTSTPLESALSIKTLSDVYLTYGTVATIQAQGGSTSTFTLSDSTSFQLPVTSSADNFNAFIAESTVGDFIEFYGTWRDIIIGEYMGDIESGRISLYTSSNPNDNYQEFTETYGVDTAKWVLIHELYVYENLPGSTSGSSLLSQKYTFTQDSNFTLPNYFRPVLKNADIDASYTIQYVCRLSNRMDGTQIIRRASFASSNPKKYGLQFTRLTVENTIPYKVFNRIEENQGVTVTGNSNIRTKYSKVFYDTSNILYNQNKEVYPNGLGPLFLKNGDGVYKFQFKSYNELTDQTENVDLSGAYDYALTFTLDNDSTIEVVPTYTSNMNTTIGELEFKITSDQVIKLLKQTNNKYTLVVKNPDGTSYSFYEGDYFSIKNIDAVTEKIKKLYPTTELQKTITELRAANEKIKNERDSLLSALSNAQSTTAAGANASQGRRDTNKARNQINELKKENSTLESQVNTLKAANEKLLQQYINLQKNQQAREENPVTSNRSTDRAASKARMPEALENIRKSRRDIEGFKYDKNSDDNFYREK